MILSTLLGLAAAATPMPCGTPAHMDAIRQAPRPVLPVRPPGAVGLEERDSCGDCDYAHVEYSEHFVVKWGDEGGISASGVQDLIGWLEESWAVEMETLGHDPPLGCETYYFNVYIGNTGQGLPSIDGASGYFTSDGEGMPMIVIHPDALGSDDWTPVVAAHELYHAVQGGTTSYQYSGDAAWYWEATANWAAGEVYPENPSYGTHLGGYALLPDLSVEFFDYPDEGLLQELHQYGAFIFPRYISEQVADPSLIVETWMGGAPDGLPLTALAAGLEARGLDVADVFGDFAAHNATWDYLDGASYEATVELYDGWYGDESRRFAGHLDRDGSGGWVEADPDARPQRYAYNVLPLADPSPGIYTLAWEGDAEGDAGSPAAWRATLVIDGVDGLIDLPLAGGEAVTFDGGEAFNAWLVVAAVPSAAAAGETFGYRYELSAPVIDTGQSGTQLTGTSYGGEDRLRVCGVAGRGGGAGGLLIALAMALGSRRRRWGVVVAAHRDAAPRPKRR